ncbi:MAG: hypothetical protein JW768_16295 [Chitinispirillaceae bacterium]|nr:hypothetical protein [Chitinispirillaceae bacterium]
MHESNTNIQRTIELSRQLLQVADTGDLEREDDTCGVLFGIVRDNAYKILKEAQRERMRHVDRGWWK